MEIALLIGRLAIAAVLVVAGITKLVDLAGFRAAVAGFGVPEHFARPVASAIPVLELAIAAALIPVATAAWGASAAALVFATFAIAIGLNLNAGRAPDCHCFGQLHSEPVSRATLMRAVALAVVSALVAGFGFSDPGASAIGWFGDLGAGGRVATVAIVLLAAVVGVLAWTVVNILAQQGRMLERLETVEASIGRHVEPAPEHGLPVGAEAPAFALPSLDGNMVSLDALRDAGRQVLLVLSDPNCGPCNRLMPAIGRWQSQYRDELTIAVVSRGDAVANRAKAAEHDLKNVLLQDNAEVASAYNAIPTPIGILIGPDGRIAAPAATGDGAIRNLVARLVGGGVAAQPAQRPDQPVGPPAPGIGEAAPAISLPALDGSTVTLDRYDGDDVLLLFWNPSCGFCQRMLPALQDWEASRPEHAPQVLIVSRGTVEENREFGFSSTVVIDDAFETGRAFGARGTPGARLIDPNGNIASEVLVGQAGVMSYLESRSKDSPRTANEPAPAPIER